MKHKYTFLGKGNNIELEKIILLYIFSQCLSEKHIFRTIGRGCIDSLLLSNKKIKSESYIPWKGFNLNCNDTFYIHEKKEKSLVNDILESYNSSHISSREICCLPYTLLGEKLDDPISFIVDLKEGFKIKDSFLLEKNIKYFSINDSKFINRIKKMIEKKNIDILEYSLDVLSFFRKETPKGSVMILNKFESEKDFINNMKHILK